MNENLIELLIWIISYDLTQSGDSDEHQRIFRDLHGLISQKYKLSKHDWDSDINKIYKSHIEMGNKMMNFYYSHFTEISVKLIEKLQNGKYENEFQELNIIGKGTYGSVFKAKNTLDNVEYAVKKVKYDGTLH